jgi:hypothetical protein
MWESEWFKRDKEEQLLIMRKYASKLFNESGGLFSAKVNETNDGLSMWIVSEKSKDCWIKCLELVRDDGLVYPAKLVLSLDPIKTREYFSSNIFLERTIQKYIGSDIVYTTLCNMDHAINKYNIESDNG